MAVSLLSLIWNEFAVIRPKDFILWSPGLLQSWLFSSLFWGGPGVCPGEFQGPWLSQPTISKGELARDT